MIPFIAPVSVTMEANPVAPTALVLDQFVPTYVHYLSSPSLQLSEEQSAVAVLDQLRELQEGWDGYDGLPATPESCSHVQQFLSFVPKKGLAAPDLSPTSNGTICLEWNTAAAEAYLEIGRTRYSGHIQPQHGEVIYLQGELSDSESQRTAIEQVLAVISQLVYGAPSSNPFSYSTQVPESALQESVLAHSE